jgi:integrase
MPRKAIFPRGWGSITPYRDGQFRVRIYIQAKREERILPTEPLAKATLEAFRRRKVEIEAGTARPAGLAEDVRVKDVIPELLDAMKAGVRRVYSKLTLRSYAIEFRVIENDPIGSRRIASLKQRDLDEFVMRLRHSGAGSSHLRHILDRLAQAIDHAVRLGYISAAPVAVGRPKYRPSTVGWCPSELELGKLIAAAKADYDKRALPAILVACDAGLRVGEIAQLRVGDVDLDRGALHVETRGESTDRTKSGDRRVVPILTPRLRSALVAAVKDRPADDRIFGVSTRDGLNGITLRAWRKGLAIEPRWHGLRRRFATWRALAGEPLPVLQRWLGHLGVATTMRYVRVPDEALLRGALGGRGVRQQGAKRKKRA